MMLFHFIGVVIFFLPYFINIAVWRSINLIQELNLVEALNGQVNLTQCFAESCTSWQIWELLIGGRRGWIFAVLSLVLIPYNGLRIYLTQQVGILKDIEVATGITPTWKKDVDFEEVNNLYRFWLKINNYRQGYRFFYRIHQALEFVFWIAIASASIHTFKWLTDIVTLPTK